MSRCKEEFRMKCQEGDGAEEVLVFNSRCWSRMREVEFGDGDVQEQERTEMSSTCSPTKVIRIQGIPLEKLSLTIGTRHSIRLFRHFHVATYSSYLSEKRSGSLKRPLLMMLSRMW